VAQILRITIKIDQTGSSTIDKIIEKVKKLNASLAEGTLNPFKTSVEGVAQSLEKVSKSLENIQGKINQTISSFRSQTKDISADVVSRGLDKATKGTEALLGRVGLVVVATGLISATLEKITVKSQSISAYASLIRTSIGETSSLLSTVINANLSLFRGNIFAIQESIERFRNAEPFFRFFFSGVSGLFVQLGGGILTFNLVRFALGETMVLLRRVTGRGMESLSVLERGTRLVTFFDKAFNRSFNTVGKFVKIGGAGLLTFFNPLFGAIPLANSIADVVLARVQNVKDQIARFFGSGRAAFTLILQDLRSLLTAVLPGLLRIGNRFATILNGLSTDQLNGIVHRLLGIEQKTKGIMRTIADVTGLTRLLDKTKTLAKVLAFPFKAIGAGVGALGRDVKATWADVKAGAGAVATIFARQGSARRKSTIVESKETEDLKKRIAELKIEDERERKFKAVRAILSSPKPTQMIIAQTAALRVEGQAVDELKKKSEVAVVALSSPAPVGAIIAQTAAFRVEGQAVEELKKKIAGLIELQNIRQRVAAGQPQFVDKPGERQRQFLQPAISSLFKKSLEKEFSQEHLNRVVQTLFKNLFGFKEEVQVPKDLANKVASILRQTLEIATKEGVKPGKDAGGAFLKALTASLKPGASPELQAAVQRTLSGISETLQKSIKFRASGTQIIRQLGEGITTATPQLGQAMGQAVERGVAAYGPRSPALLGPLVFLPKMGFNIVAQLVQGIRSAFGLLGGIMDRLTALISDPLQRIRGIAQTAFLAERTGTSVQTISALSSAIEQVGGNAGDLNFALTRVQETLSRSITPEDFSKFARLGISIDNIKASTDPALAMFGEVAEVVKKFGINSHEAREALDLLGVTSSSSLVNLLMQGREGLQEMTGEISEFGGVIDQTMAQNAKSIFQIETKLKQFKEFLLNQVLAEFLPQIKSVSDTVFGFIKANATRIRAFIVFVADILKNLGSLLSAFISFAINDPRAALSAIFSIVGSFMQLIGRQIATFFLAIKDSISTLLSAVFAFIGSFLSSVFPPLWERLGLLIDVVIAFIEKKLFDFLPALWEFLRSIPGLIVDMLSFLLKVIATELAKIGSFFFDWYKRSLFVAAALVEKLIFAIIKKATDTIKGTPFEEVIRFVGLGGFLDQAITFAEDSEAVFAEINKQQDQAWLSFTETQEKLKAEAKGLTFEVKSVDDQLDVALEALNKDKPLAEIFINAATTASSELAKIQEAAKQLGTALADPALFEKFKSNTAQAVSEVGETIKGLGLKEEFEKVLASLSPENFEEKLAEITAKIQEFKDRTQGILGVPGVPGGKGNAADTGGFLDNLLNMTPTITLSKEMEKLMALGQATSEVFGNLGQVFTDVFELSGKKAKEFAIAAKGIAIGEATIKIALGVLTALSTLPPPLSFIQAAAVAAAGGIQIGKIISQGFAAGGLIAAGTGPKADDVPIRASKGEFVIPADAVRLYGVDFMESLRQKLVPKMPAVALAPNIPSPAFQQPMPRNTFANGGLVAPVAQEKAPVIANFIDPDIFAQFMARQSGRQVLINIMRDENREINAALQA